MATIEEAYNEWSEQYDTNSNKTRDLESTALRDVLACVPFNDVLELGCGTGKNTSWLARQAARVTAVDFSAGMLERARQKIDSPHVHFVQGDMHQDWSRQPQRYDLAVFSLVLEHIEHLAPLFHQVADALRPGGYLYVGELHPFRQYAGSKARFDTVEGTKVLTCYTHHVSDFSSAAGAAGLQLLTLEEYFDEDDRAAVPRLLVFLFRKPPA